MNHALSCDRTGEQVLWRTDRGLELRRAPARTRGATETLRETERRYLDAAAGESILLTWGRHLVILPNGPDRSRAWRRSAFARLLGRRQDLRRAHELDHGLIADRSVPGPVAATAAAREAGRPDSGYGAHCDLDTGAWTFERPLLLRALSTGGPVLWDRDLRGRFFSPLGDVGEVRSAIPGFHIFSTARGGSGAVAGGGCSVDPAVARRKAVFEWIERTCHDLAGLSASECSTGTAAHVSRDAAREGALFELAERTLVRSTFRSGNWWHVPSGGEPSCLARAGFGVRILLSRDAWYLPTVLVCVFDRASRRGVCGTASKKTVAEAIASALAEAVTSYTRHSRTGGSLSVADFDRATGGRARGDGPAVAFDAAEVDRVFDPKFQDITHPDLIAAGIYVQKARARSASPLVERASDAVFEALNIWS